jgi:di/tricarboxylate transporter
MINFFKKLLILILALLIIVVAGSVSYYWLTNKPRAERRPATISVPLVDVITPSVIDHPVTVFALGNVVAAQSVNLNSQVDGMVISVSENFIEGGLLKKARKSSSSTRPITNYAYAKHRTTWSGPSSI